MDRYKRMSASGHSCYRCLLGSAHNTSVQRRWIGDKFIAKEIAAESEWQRRAQRITDGKERNLWDILEERGFIKDTLGTRKEIADLMRKKRVKAYVGFDPTAGSLHLGHLLPLMVLFWMYMHGYGAYTLIGGSTAKIGDPTDRLQSREKIAKATMTLYMTKLHYQLKRLWNNVEYEARRIGFEREWAWKRALVNNNSWWNSQPLLELLRIVGHSVRIGPMLSRDTVKTKMTKGDGMSFAEFTYPIMQGWDWWKLYKSNGVQMQIGGSDQYGNIVSGAQIVKVARENDVNPQEERPGKGFLDDLVGFTVPLLTSSSGSKFGKSEGNAIWLDDTMTSVFDFYGYLVRRPDGEVERLLNVLTFLPAKKIKEIMAEHDRDRSKRVAQHMLAVEVTALVHGRTSAGAAQSQHRSMFGGSGVMARPEERSGKGGRQATAHPLNGIPPMSMILPEIVLKGNIIRLIKAAGFVETSTEATRLLNQGAFYVGGTAIREGAEMPDAVSYRPLRAYGAEELPRFMQEGNILVLRKGKHNVRVIRFVDQKEWEESGLRYNGEAQKEVGRRTTRPSINTQRFPGNASADGEDQAEEAGHREKRSERNRIDFPMEEPRSRARPGNHLPGGNTTITMPVRVGTYTKRWMTSTAGDAR